MPEVHPNAAPGPSLIAGSGLVATGPIDAGETVLVYDDDPESDAALSPVNHSCEPNLAWADDRTLVAHHDIPAGTELTTDYALRITDPAFVLFCHCETYRCRQAIEGTDWRIPQLRARYAGWYAPSVRHRIDSDAAAPG